MYRGFLPFFCFSPLSLLFPKDRSPVTVLVWLASYPRQRRKIKKQQLLANWLGRWRLPPRASPVASSSSLTSLCEEQRARGEEGAGHGTGDWEGPRSQRTRAIREPSPSTRSGRRESYKPRPPPCPQRATPGCWDSAHPPGICSEGTQRLGEQQGRWVKLAPYSERRRLGWGPIPRAPDSSESCLFQWVCAHVPAWAAGNGFENVNKEVNQGSWDGDAGTGGGRC